MKLLRFFLHSSLLVSSLLFYSTFAKREEFDKKTENTHKIQLERYRCILIFHHKHTHSKRSICIKAMKAFFIVWWKLVSADCLQNFIFCLVYWLTERWSRWKWFGTNVVNHSKQYALSKLSIFRIKTNLQFIGTWRVERNLSFIFGEFHGVFVSCQ